MAKNHNTFILHSVPKFPTKDKKTLSYTGVTFCDIWKFTPFIIDIVQFGWMENSNVIVVTGISTKPNTGQNKDRDLADICEVEQGKLFI